MTEGDGIETVRVEGARKRDAGRGIARLSSQVQSTLGVVSGDPIIIEGEELTVAKVWPGDDITGPRIRIDADTRDSIGANIGDTVSIRRGTVEDALEVTLQPADEQTDKMPSQNLVRHRFRDRLLREGKRIRIDGYGVFTVTDTTPTGSVRLTASTDVTVRPDVAPGDGQDGNEESGETGVSGTTYEDIGGLDQELDLVREMVELPLSEPELFGRLGIEPPKGVLLYGPPGTGKTLIARAVANEVDAHFDTISGPEIVSKYKGESAERLRDAFDRASENAPSILFIDEIDSIAGARDDEADMENRVVAQLLTLMDGLEDNGEVVVIGATNRVDSVDPALRRGGRFDREIEIGVPDEQGRREIFDVHTREMPLADDVDLDALAGITHGFVGADIASVAREAGMARLRDRDRGDGDDELALTHGHFEDALAAVEPSARQEYVAETPATTFDDVGGLETAKERLREAVEWPLVYGPLFDAAATDPPSGVLLHGPPGTGKTLLAEAIAGESNVSYLRVAGPELLDRYVGETEASIRDLFDRARQTAPAIVFLDEIDGIARKRGDGHEMTERVVSQLLTEMDSIADHPKIVVLAATNRKKVLDSALLRPGRFEQHVAVPNPDETARREILRVHTSGTPLGDGVDLGALAAETQGYSGADLKAIVRAASMRAIRDVAESIDPSQVEEHTDEVTVTQEHVAAARETVGETD